jgi:hypothetical protein
LGLKKITQFFLSQAKHIVGRNKMKKAFNINLPEVLTSFNFGAFVAQKSRPAATDPNMPFKLFYK